MAILSQTPWLRGLRQIESGICAVEKIVCGLSLAVMAISIAVTVAVRNLDLPLPNVGELGLAAMVPLTLVGGALCTCLGSHVTIDLVRHAPWRAVRTLAEVAVAIATTIFAYLYMRSGIHLVEDFLASGDKLLDLGTPLWMLALCFPLGTALMMFHAVMRVLAMLAGEAAVPDRTRNP
ncbi:TRAP transporter small permease [Salinisphaera orenii]|uniref:TRAP transporter small permease protein n=1 Tax=Salinisphaera orenii YIM 95161 TaxID=1051139 RepID=A0A423Q361_9GAMM|nr:TRAP transporter small permease [Salinisphaera halophila]ROO33045.1 hypothetical protein SAHL_04445 [Salinisphaera halophila YIM 95161]